MHWVAISAVLVGSILDPSPTPLPRVENELEFVGFSKNGSVAAWKETIRHFHEEGVDHYTLIRIQDSGNGGLLGSFRHSDIKRTTPNGRKVLAAPDVLAAANEPWRMAESRKAWQRTKRRGKFRKRSLQWKDDAVVLRPDDGIKLQSEQDGDTMVLTSLGGISAYWVIARRYNGDMVPIARVKRTSHSGAPVTSRIRVFYAMDGYQVAVAHRFEVQEEGFSYVVSVPSVRALGEHPLGTYELGAMNTARERNRSAKRIFKELHPGYSDLYDRYGW